MRPFLPPQMDFIPFTFDSLLQHLSLSGPLSLGQGAQYVKSFALSPFVLWWIISHCRRQAIKIIRYYVQFMISRPDNPDEYSLKGAEADDYAPEDIPGLATAVNNQSNLFSKVKGDFLAYVQKLQFHFTRRRHLLEGRHMRIGRKSLTESDDEPQNFVDTGDTTTRSLRARTSSSTPEKLIRSVAKNASESFHETHYSPGTYVSS